MSPLLPGVNPLGFGGDTKLLRGNSSERIQVHAKQRRIRLPAIYKGRFNLLSKDAKKVSLKLSTLKY